MRKLIPSVILVVVFLAIFYAVASAQDTSTENETMTEEEALLARGEYLINMAGCISCHSPLKEEYSDLTALTVEQLQTISLSALEALDIDDRRLAGGRPFDLGPAGVLYSANLTPDEETGIGTWTDEQIEVAVRIGINPSGRRLFPLMPYASYFNMAESDMDAIIAYLRSLPAVSNEVDRSGPSGEGIAPDLVLEGAQLLAEPPTDPQSLGAYLVTSVMVCSDCHTPLDPNTGIPQFDRFLSGGQPYEGPWGIVYGGNITPDETTGLGSWEHDDYVRVFREGVRIDGRRLVLMPWEDYAVITDDDLDALITYLRSIPAVENEVPAPAIAEPFVQYVEN